MIGVSSLSEIESEFDNKLCGVWGCSPPVAAVLSVHALWGMVFVPASLFVRFKFSKRIGRITGLTTILIALTALVAIVIYEDFHWYTFVSLESRIYFGRRIALALFTQTDFPVIVLLLAGILLRWLSLERSSDFRESIDDQSRKQFDADIPSNHLEEETPAVHDADFRSVADVR